MFALSRLAKPVSLHQTYDRKIERKRERAKQREREREREKERKREREREKKNKEKKGRESFPRKSILSTKPQTRATTWSPPPPPPFMHNQIC
jgi:Ni/Co efflux regulator RcnB